MSLFLQLPTIHFDFGAVSALPSELERLNMRRPLLVTDANLVNLDAFSRVRAAVASYDATVFAEVPPNPTVTAVHQCMAAYRDRDCDGIVAVGGGSVIDCGKAAVLLATHPGDLTRYLGHPDRIASPPAPLIAVPTTAGSGSEVSRGCGIHTDATSRGLGINHPFMVPRVAVCDPELTFTLPPRLTAGTGLDALSHCVEGYLATTVNPVVDAIALDGIRRLSEHIGQAVADGRNREGRWHVMLAAMQGGISIWKGLGPAHAIANTCGDRGLHHGTLSTIALPPVLRLLEPKTGDKMRAIAGAMGCKAGESAADAIETLNTRLGIPRTIRELGYGQANIDEMAHDAAGSFFNKPSPYRPTFEEYRTILTSLLE